MTDKDLGVSTVRRHAIQHNTCIVDDINMLNSYIAWYIGIYGTSAAAGQYTVTATLYIPKKPRTNT